MRWGAGEELLETIRELTRHIQLKDQILEHFVPPEEYERVPTANHDTSHADLQGKTRACWDDGKDEWYLKPMDMTALNM